MSGGLGATAALSSRSVGDVGSSRPPAPTEYSIQYRTPRDRLEETDIAAGPVPTATLSRLGPDPHKPRCVRRACAPDRQISTPETSGKGKRAALCFVSTTEYCILPRTHYQVSTFNKTADIAAQRAVLTRVIIIQQQLPWTHTTAYCTGATTSTVVHATSMMSATEKFYTINVCLTPSRTDCAT